MSRDNDSSDEVSGSKRMRQTDAERALAELLPTLADFEHRFTGRIKGPQKTHWRLRLEIGGQGPVVTDVDLNDFAKRKPREEPS